GLFGAIELRRNARGERLVPFGGAHPAMGRLLSFLREEGLFTVAQWSTLMCNPPLCISEEELQLAFDIIDRGLEITDEAFGDRRPALWRPPRPGLPPAASWVDDGPRHVRGDVQMADERTVGIGVEGPGRPPTHVEAEGTAPASVAPATISAQQQMPRIHRRVIKALVEGVG